MIWRYQRTLSYRLLAWSLLSVLAGAVLWFSGSAYNQGLGLQAAVWGLIDAAIAFFGLRGLSQKLNQRFDPGLAEKDTARLRKLLWINTGLDVAYIAAGLALALTLGKNDPFTSGSGWGVVVQGAFLFAFDLLHALGVPREVYIPDNQLFTSDLHEPYATAGEKGIVILVHGFPGTPIEMRALGEELRRDGWGVRGLLLPGFGRQIPTLFQQRASQWSQYIADQVNAAKASGQKVILVGFSMGAGLSVPAAAKTNPTALVLVSPFWFDINPFSDALLTVASLFLPETFNPFKLIPARRIEESSEFSPPPGHLYPTAPEFFRDMKDVHLPLIFLEQFAVLSRSLKDSLGQIKSPVLVLQGAQDRVVRPAQTRKLVRWLSPPPPYKEIPGEHHIVMPDNPAFSRVAAEIIAYINQFA